MHLDLYLAGKYQARERLKGIREKLRELGFNVTSSWMDNRYTTEDVPMSVSTLEAANNIAEVCQADVFMLDTLDESTTGGREVELGWAMANGIIVILIGPYRNVFHKTLTRYETWDDFFANPPTFPKRHF